MGIYEELIARGLIAQVTNEDEIREMVNNGPATFYIVFACPADSLAGGPDRDLSRVDRGFALYAHPRGHRAQRRVLQAPDGEIHRLL